VSGVNPPSDMPEWMRQQAKAMALEQRKANPFPRIVALEDFGALVDVTLALGTEGFPVRYWKDRGRVHLEGRVDNGGGLTLSTALQTVFTLPAGYLPEDTQAFLTPGNSFTGACRVQVNTTGTVQIQTFAGSTSTPTICYLSGISFRAP
jgi:hypothetical protein